MYPPLRWGKPRFSREFTHVRVGARFLWVQPHSVRQFLHRNSLRAAAIVSAIVALWIVREQGAGIVAPGGEHGLEVAWFQIFWGVTSLSLVWANLMSAQRFGLASLVGRAVALLSMATLSWLVGELFWLRLSTCADWVVLPCGSNDDVPFPAMADVFYLAFFPLAALGLWYLARGIGTTRADRARATWVLVPAVLLAAHLVLPRFELGSLTLGTDVFGHNKEGLAGVVTMTFYLLGDVLVVWSACVVAVTARRTSEGALAHGASLIVLGCWCVYAADTFFFTWLPRQEGVLFSLSDLFYGLGAVLMPLGVRFMQRAPRDLIVPVPTGPASIHDRLATSVLLAHRALLGSTAHSAASRVRGVKIEGDSLFVSGSADPSGAVRELVERYAEIVGPFSLRLSLSAAHALAEEPYPGDASLTRMIDELEQRLTPRDEGGSANGARLEMSQTRLLLAINVLALGLLAWAWASGVVTEWPGSQGAVVATAVVLLLNAVAIVVSLRTRRQLGLTRLYPSVLTICLAIMVFVAGSPDGAAFIIFLPASAVWCAVFCPRGAYPLQIAVLMLSTLAVAVVAHLAERDLEFLLASTVLGSSILALSSLGREVGEVRARARDAQDLNASLGGFVDSLEQARNEERHRIAGELHDHALQGLIAAQLALHQAQDATPGGPGHELVAHARSLTSDAVRSLRDIMRGIEPVALFNDDLAAALRSLVDELGSVSQIEFHVETDVALSLPLRYQRTLYRVLREAMMNAAHHSGASSVWVRLGAESGELVARVRDDGRGFSASADPTATEAVEASDRDDGHTGLGLRLMAEQVRGLEGTFQIVSVPGEGTTVTIRLPAP